MCAHIFQKHFGALLAEMQAVRVKVIAHGISAVILEQFARIQEFQAHFFRQVDQRLVEFIDDLHRNILIFSNSGARGNRRNDDIAIRICVLNGFNALAIRRDKRIHRGSSVGIVCAEHHHDSAWLDALDGIRDRVGSCAVFKIHHFGGGNALDSHTFLAHIVFQINQFIHIQTDCIGIPDEQRIIQIVLPGIIRLGKDRLCVLFNVNALSIFIVTVTGRSVCFIFRRAENQQAGNDDDEQKNEPACPQHVHGFFLLVRQPAEIPDRKRCL